MRFSIKSDKKRPGFSKKLMISYSILLFVILLIGLYLYNISHESLQRSLEETTRLQLRNTVRSLDNDLASMRQLSLYMAGNTDIRQLADSTPESSASFFMDAWETQKSISIYTPIQQLLPIASYYIYFENSDYIITSTSAFNIAEQYYNDASMESSHYGQWKDTLTDPEKYQHFLPMSEFRQGSADYLYILPLYNNYLYQLPAQLCFVISHAQLENIFAPLTASEGGFLYVENQDGETEFSLGASDASRAPASSLDFEELTFEDGVVPVTYNGERMLIFHQSSSVNSWDYYYVLPLNTLYQSLASYRSMFLLVMGAGLLIGFLLICLISHRNERPFLQLGTQLQDSQTRATRLQASLDYHQPLVRSSYIRSLMLGRVSSPDEMDYIRKYLGLDSEGHSYRVLYIVTYPDDEQIETPSQESQEASGQPAGDSPPKHDSSVETCLEKHFGAPLFLFHPKVHNYAILLDIAEGDAVDDGGWQLISSRFTAFHNEMLDSFSIWTIGGLGNVNHLLENTWKSYQQASEAVSYASGPNLIQSYFSLVITSDMYYYPTQLAESMANFITAGNREQVIEIFKFITKENLEKRSLSYDRMHALLSDIYSTVSRIRYNIPDADSNEIVARADQMLKEYPSLNQLEKAALTLCGFYKGMSSQQQTIGNIKAYIRKNYKDSSLCLTKLSDEFNLSESYLSWLFKEATGENFSAYLEQIRMEAALHLVRDTDTPLSDLYMEVGYNNANSFRRVFKKVYGVSAKAMRDAMQSGKGNMPPAGKGEAASEAQTASASADTPPKSFNG